MGIFADKKARRKPSDQVTCKIIKNYIRQNGGDDKSPFCEGVDDVPKKEIGDRVVSQARWPEQGRIQQKVEMSHRIFSNALPDNELCQFLTSQF